MFARKVGDGEDTVEQHLGSRSGWSRAPRRAGITTTSPGRDPDGLAVLPADAAALDHVDHLDAVRMAVRARGPA